uniref:Uncharacterized protein n=1 Tax=Candidatus Methanogaster sp. ANME-2c ERB4 TaxID=2759911 RepID=A0A7G9YKW2_9EURY|nr:hypothetical protein HKDIPMJM_00002 [Methanosarcinales archaeon ANME-2c ERB4]QNO48646.1 hypothetical protein LENKHJGJ_00017 [Methanosarcinales archaeon ANME-2c ERB4]QNO50138.1 hypothetical protein MOOMDFED_00006 [Methanosarcinales archaeon ANME-2c ERB4]QNO50254.1 hypothetical protein KDJOFGEH_00006 [Methanosarcinales archaeon ANME-2c ERB4]
MIAGMDMRKRIYYHFPKRDTHFEQRYRYYGDLPYLVRTMAGIDGKHGMFATESPDRRGHSIQARRCLEVYIVENNLEFVHLTLDNVEEILGGIESDGMLDFKMPLKYSYLDGKYNRIPFAGDDYLVRANLDGDLLTLQVHLDAGYGRTECGRVADTIVEELRRGMG